MKSGLSRCILCLLIASCAEAVQETEDGSGQADVRARVDSERQAADDPEPTESGSGNQDADDQLDMGTGSSNQHDVELDPDTEEGTFTDAAEEPIDVSHEPTEDLERASDSGSDAENDPGIDLTADTTGDAAGGSSDSATETSPDVETDTGIDTAADTNPDSPVDSVDETKPDSVSDGPSDCTGAGIGFGTSFESGDGGYGFTEGQTGGEGGADWWNLISSASLCHSGTGCWGSTGDDYGNCQSAELVSPAIDLSACGAEDTVQLSFWHFYDFESQYSAWDGGNLQFSSNGGSTWVAITSPTDDPYFEAIEDLGTCSPETELRLAGGMVWGGSNEAWTEVTVNIPHSYRADDFRFRFVFSSDPSNLLDYAGWRVDDLQIRVP